MACMLASNVKYISADSQSPSFGSKKPLTMTLMSDRANRKCRGKGFPYSTQTRTKIKPEYEKYVKSQTRILSQKEKERMTNAAKVMTTEERLDAIAKQEELTKLRNEQAEMARKYFRKIDDEKAKAGETNMENDEDLFGKAEQEKTLDRAFIAKQEQDEDVRAVNSYMLHARCQAIRDIQIKEKREFERKQTEERIRLERMVIEQNAKAVAKDDAFAVERKERSAKYAAEIQQQLLQRQSLRLMEAERVEAEGRMFREANAALQLEEKRIAREARERQVKFRNELDRIVEMSMLFKKMLCEQEKEMDRRIAEYRRAKAEREAELKREKQVAKANYERKQQLLYELAKKRMSSQTEREELQLLREREHAEREYRRREKQSALLRKKLEDDIKSARLRQLEDIRRRQALQIAREERSFQEMIQALSKAEEQEKKKEEERQKRRDSYRSEITKQMKDKAEIERLLLENSRNENKIWREAERQRLANVRAVIGAKLSAMRDACLPESYIKDIERQMDRLTKRNATQK